LVYARRRLRERFGMTLAERGAGLKAAAGRRHAARAWLALFLLALPATPAAAQLRSESVAGWRIAYGGSGDGGHVVRLSRNGRGYRLSHELEFWRGNGGVVMGATFRRGRCRSGDAGVIVPFEQGLSRATFDMRLADYLRACPLPRAELAVLLRGLDRAWPRFLRRARRALAAIRAENEAIVRHGEER
jgi:hypothetical protein